LTVVNDASCPCSGLVKVPRLTPLQGCAQVGPISQIDRHCVPYGGIAVSKVRVLEGTGGVEVEEVIVIAIIGDPRVPHPAVGQLERHRDQAVMSEAAPRTKNGASPELAA